MIIPLLKNDLLVAEIDTEIVVMKHRWLQEPTADQFEAGLVQLQLLYLEHVGAYPGLKWLADTKMLGQRSYEEEQWLEKTWEVLLFEKAGVKVHAVILGDDIFADYSMEKFKGLAAAKYKEVGVKLGVFLTEEDAIAWLKQN